MSAVAVTSPREERYRLATVAAGVPLMLLVAPFCVSSDGRPLLAEAAADPGLFLIVGSLVGWPVLIGVLSLARGLRRRVPGGVAFGVPAVLYALLSVGLAALLLIAFVMKAQARREPVVLVGAVAGVVAAYLLGRGFRRAGWERWAQLVAGMWLAHWVIGLLVALGDGSPFGDQGTGGWILLFALGALAPIVGWALWPRKGEEMLRRGG